MHVFTAALVFLSMATLTKHRILRYESYFPIFRAFVFFPKNIENITSNFKEQFWTQKSPQNDPRGSVLGPKMVPISRRRGQKSVKLSKIVVFCPSHFLNIFWHGVGLDFGPEPDRLPRLYPRVPRIPAAQYIYIYIYTYIYTYIYIYMYVYRHAH